jgi:hypothetical protein
MFAVWMDLLRENPKSVLWLMKLNEDAQRNLAASANAFGIDPARLVFATRVPRIEDHLARYRLADVCLDTFPYNGHTTTSDALLAGVPVVTLAGQGFASRVASSLLCDFADGNLVASSENEVKLIAGNLVSKTSLRPNQENHQIETIKMSNDFTDLIVSRI